MDNPTVMQFRDNTVRIEAARSGFGFIVGERAGYLYIATARHILFKPGQEADPDAPAPTKAKVWFYSDQGKSLDADVQETHAEDLAVLKIRKPEGLKWTKCCLADSLYQRRSTQVWFIGRTQQWKVPVRSGYIAGQSSTYEIELEDLNVTRGTSGAPLISGSGLVGMIVEDDAINPLALIVDFIESNFKKWDYPWDLIPATETASIAPTKPAAIAPTKPAAAKERTESLAASVQSPGGSWKFATSGDSRNCGDIVMPAIAEGVLNDGASFYWHLGDYRAIYMFDEDYARLNSQSAITDYQNNAWPDFINRQLKPFGSLPIFLAMGNHELIQPKTHNEAVAQFADWYDSPAIKQQRLADDLNDHLVKTYYHWIERGVDFITLDNSDPDQFGPIQMGWITAELARAAENPAIRTLVIGMHAAFPDSTSAGHSMNDSAQEQKSGRQVYKALLDFRNTTHKNVYVLASHSHYVMDNIYATACHAKEDVLPGWIVGSAGAVRYRLPSNVGEATIAKTDVYGYVLATVAPDSTISFEFRPVDERDVPSNVVQEYSLQQVRWCFAENKSGYQVPGPTCPVVH